MAFALHKALGLLRLNLFKTRLSFYTISISSTHIKGFWSNGICTSQSSGYVLTEPFFVDYSAFVHTFYTISNSLYNSSVI